MDSTIRASALLLLFLTQPASAVDPPHLATRTPSQGCLDCHALHGAPGPSLQRDVGSCVGCHASQASPPLSQWSSGDQATPGVSGSSHRWDAASGVNPTYGATLPSDPEMLKRLAGQPMTCAVCHDPHSQAKVPFDVNAWDRSHFLRFPNADGGICLQCHSSRNVTSASTYTGAPQSHPVGKPLPGANAAYFAKPRAVGGGDQVDSTVTSNLALVSGGVASLTAGNVTCMTCHGVHYADSDSSTQDDRPRAGDGTLLRRSFTSGGLRGSTTAGKDDACSGCHTVSGHSGSVGTGSKYTFTFGCKDCHDGHGTRNIKLVKESLTYASGSTTSGVDLRALGNGTGGVGPYDLASSVAPGTGPCEGCHTQTQDRDPTAPRPRFRNSGEGANNGRHFTNNCLGCHEHRNGFKGSEPNAPTVACDPCHRYGMRSADAEPLKQSTYHHVMESDVVAGYAPAAVPTLAVDGDKRCIQCHVDHPFGANPGANLRTSVTTATAVSTDYSAAAPFGPCVSCHASPQLKNGTDQKSDGTTVTYAISAADFGASAHKFATEPSGSMFRSATGSFTVACVKCHSDGQPTATQGGTNRFALHSSPDRRLRSPLGITSFTNGGDALEERFCYRCHSASTDVNPGGGPAKATTASDYFGAVANMSPGSTGLFSQMQKGTANVTPGPTTATTTLFFQPPGLENPVAPMPVAQAPDTTTFATNVLYLKSKADELPSGPLPVAYLMTSGLYDTDELRSRVMSPVQGTTLEEYVVLWNGGYLRVGQFSSPPIATRFTWRAGTALVLLLHAGQNYGWNGGCHRRWAAFKWNANGTLGPQFVATGESINGAELRFEDLTVSSDVTFSQGDKLLVELELSTPEWSSWAQCASYWGSLIRDSRLMLPNRPDGHLPEFTFAAPPVEGGTWAGRSMTPFAPTGAVNETREAAAAVPSGTRLWRRASFLSPPVATATTTVQAPWTIHVFDRQSDAAANAHVRYKIYGWMADGTRGPDIVPWTTWGSSPGTVTAMQTITTPAGAAVALAVGDKVVVDLELQTLNVDASTAGTYGLEVSHGPTALSNLVMPGSVTFTYNDRGTAAVGRHDVGFYSGVHRPHPSDEGRGYVAANRHVECEDCHDPHSTRSGLHAAGSNVAGQVLRGAPAVAPAPPATNWEVGTTATYATTTVGATTPEAHVCFRCHSSFNTAIPEDPSGLPAPPWSTGGGGFTNTALEFSPSNASGHPVLASLNDYPNSLGPKTLAADQLCSLTTCPPATNPGARYWTPGQTMTCTDCHASDAASPAAQGPHGSAYRYMLAGPNRAWPYTVAGATSGTLFQLGVNTEDDLGGPSGNGLFCRNCHPTPYDPNVAWRGTGTNDMHWRMGWGHGFDNGFGGSCPNGCRDCVRCHIVVPHGGKVSRLIATVNAPARYKIPGVGPLFTGFTKAPNRNTDYWNRFSFDPQWGCGTGHYTDTPPLEAW
jgi:hypothetical protein